LKECIIEKKSFITQSRIKKNKKLNWDIKAAPSCISVTFEDINENEEEHNIIDVIEDESLKIY